MKLLFCALMSCGYAGSVMEDLHDGTGVSTNGQSLTGILYEMSKGFSVDETLNKHLQNHESRKILNHIGKWKSNAEEIKEENKLIEDGKDAFFQFLKDQEIQLEKIMVPRQYEDCKKAFALIYHRFMDLADRFSILHTTTVKVTGIYLERIHTAAAAREKQEQLSARIFVERFFFAFLLAHKYIEDPGYELENMLELFEAVGSRGNLLASLVFPKLRFVNRLQALQKSSCYLPYDEEDLKLEVRKASRALEEKYLSLLDWNLSVKIDEPNINGSETVEFPNEKSFYYC